VRRFAQKGWIILPLRFEVRTPILRAWSHDASNARSVFGRPRRRTVSPFARSGSRLVAITWSSGAALTNCEEPKGVGRLGRLQIGHWRGHFGVIYAPKGCPGTFATSQLETAEYHFYGALTRAACWNSTNGEQRRRHLEALTAHHRQLKIWAEHCAENFENRAALVEAEIARIEGRTLDAEDSMNKPSARRTRTALPIMKRWPTNSRAASTWHVDSKRPPTPICAMLGTTTFVGELTARCGSWTSCIRSSRRTRR
jgi:hypothetical protein